MAPTLPEDGDLIEVFRSLYQHWAVYVGDGFIVQFAPPSEVSPIPQKGIVTKEELLKMVGSDEWKIHNSLDKKYHPHPALDIVKEACAMVGDEMHYDVITYNCEHFANDMRYGKPESRQVRRAAIIVLLTGWLVAWFWFIIAYLSRPTSYLSRPTSYLMSCRIKEKKEKKNEE